MRDPLDDDSWADLGDLDVTPPPVADVRGRGDRLRRRRTLLSVTGAAVAVVAVVAASSLLGGGGTQQPAPVPATTTTGPAPTPEHTPGSTEPPDPAPEGSLAAEFPLALGLPDTNEDGTPVTVKVGPASEAFSFCGVTAWTGEAAMDVAGATYQAPEDYRTRTLMLFATTDEAQQTLQLARDALAGCADEAPDDDGVVVTPVEDALGEESVVAEMRFRADGLFDTGLTVYRLVREGPAVLLTIDYAEANGSPETRQSFYATTSDAAQPVLDELGRVFGQDSPTPPRGMTIPADFPLDEPPLTSGGDFEITGPSDVGLGVGPLSFCGDDTWPYLGGSRLTVSSLGPEYAEVRELITYPDAEAAVSTMTDLRRAVRACPSEEIEGAGGEGASRVHEELTSSVEFETVALATYVDPAQPGLSTLLFVRVGSAVLALQVSSEGIGSVAAEDLAELDAVAAEIVPEMCLFTEDGC